MNKSQIISLPDDIPLSLGPPLRLVVQDALALLDMLDRALYDSITAVERECIATMTPDERARVDYDPAREPLDRLELADAAIRAFTRGVRPTDRAEVYALCGGRARGDFLSVPIHRLRECVAMIDALRPGGGRGPSAWEIETFTRNVRAPFEYALARAAAAAAAAV